jgi:hypothetical protein
MKKFFLKFKKWILTILGIGAITIVITFGGTTNDTTIAKLSEKYDKATEIKNKYSLEGATLKTITKSDPKDKIEVVVGKKADPNKLGADTNFEPDITLSRWDEVGFTIKPDISGVALKDRALTLKNEKILFETPKINYEMYNVEPNAEFTEGAYKFVWYLKEKPTTNVFTFGIQTKGLDFFYQPIYTEEEILEFAKNGDHKNRDAMGSYAVYHSAKGGMNDKDGKEYKTGKAFHIYRPRLIDSNGNWTWGELSIDIENGLYIVRIPQDFLDKAVYPIKSNDTFGYTTIGANLDTSAGQYGSIFASGSAGDITSLSGALVTMGGEQMGPVIYDSSYNRLAIGSAITTPTTYPIVAFTSQSIAYTMSSANYWLCWSGNSGGLRAIAYDAGTTNQGGVSAGSYQPDPWEPNLNNNKYSVYATYTAGGGGGTVVEDPPQIIIVD